MDKQDNNINTYNHSFQLIEIINLSILFVK